MGDLVLLKLQPYTEFSVANKYGLFRKAHSLSRNTELALVCWSVILLLAKNMTCHHITTYESMMPAGASTEREKKGGRGEKSELLHCKYTGLSCPGIYPLLP